MTEQEYHDLLIRLDTRQAAIEEDLKELKTILGGRLCQTHAEKIRTHDKFIWGAWALGAAALAKSFFLPGGGGQ